MNEEKKRSLVGLRIFISLIILIFSAFLASLAFPSKYSQDGIAFLAFIYLVPVFYIIYSSSWRMCALYGLIYGFLFYYLYNYWLSTFHPLAILLAPILESVEYALLFLSLKLLSVLFEKKRGFFVCLLYNGFLYLTQQGFLGYPYGNITASLYEYTSLIQIVSITGIWGLGLLVTLPQSLLADYLYSKRTREKLKPFLFSIIVLLLVWITGIFVKTYYENKESDKSISIAAIQHSADTWKGGYNTYKENYETLKKLTQEAMLSSSPDMVVWSETAFVPSVRWHQTYNVSIKTRSLVDSFVDFSLNLGVPLITGNPEGVIKDKDYEPVLENGDWNWKTYNTVIYFAFGEVKGTYRKRHLVPFTEYFPYEKEFPHLYKLLLANDYKWWERGTESTVFDYNGIKFSTPICFEDTFGALNAQFVINGADILINLSNDYWSRSLEAEEQHFQLSVFRAIENRRALLRSTNSGITALVLPSGRITGRLEPFTQSIGIYEVPLYEKMPLTFYTRHPDFFGKFFVVFSLLSILYGVSVKVYEREKNKNEEKERLSHLFEDMENAW